MDVTRAKQILSSSDTIPVQYEGRPIWIDELDESTKTAKVHVEHNPAEMFKVSVQELSESH